MEKKMTEAWAFPLRYVIAIDTQRAGKATEIMETGYEGKKPKAGQAIRYGNLLDQTGTSA